ncbi:MopE-related protein, partial [Thermodesulfobacteriota bacterium]
PATGCGYTDNTEPCDDGNACTMDDVCSEGTCSGGVPLDEDGDSYVSDVCEGDDCDDGNPDINPGAAEVPDDGIDQDCNGADTITCVVDADMDGFGTEAGTTVLAPDGTCDTADGESNNSLDCDDTDVGVYPGAPEIPGDGIDQDCNGADTITCIVDADMDGYGTDAGTTVLADDGFCDTAQGESNSSDDCDDSNQDIHPEATEVCDGVDNDCSPLTDDGVDEFWFGDACDGPDSDLCMEGVYECSGGAQSCTDVSGDDLDVCDGEDNDCNPATADGTDEAWLDDDCDGADSDFCEEGVYECAGGAQSCTDTTGDDLDVCDGVDNDCNPATPDGVDAEWLGDDCDGPDSDLCMEGVYECAGGAQSCTDNTGDDLDVCDGVDNDCNPATADGDHADWLGDPCDGADSDLCEEGVYECSGGAQSCTDVSGDDLDVCDGEDNDCNPATPDGADEAWLGDACDGADSDLCLEGELECAAGAQTCTDDTGDNLELCDGEDNDCNPATADGADEAWLGAACDGADSDLCEEGNYECASGAQTCSDDTGDDIEVCDGADNDCDGGTDEEGDALCDDELYCNGPEICDGVNGCLAGVAPDCDDGVGCTVDACNEDTDRCDHTPNDGLCDDSLWCNGAETCDEVNDCQAGEAPDCGDGVGCTVDTCNEDTDTCDHAGDDGLCDDGFWCNGAETCNEVDDCQASEAPDCADAVSCTEDTCNEETDTCEHTANDGLCDNGLFCDGAETCDEANDCQAGVAPDCDDGVGCTLDACNEDTGTCDHTGDDGLCDDGFWCNGAETCDAVNDCQAGTAPDCDDGVGCTLDACNEDTDRCDHTGDD